MHSEHLFVGRYRVVSMVGRGGMGEVYKVFDIRTERYIALKKMRKELKHRPAAVARFLRECKILASLSHPSIIPIFEIGEDDDKLSYYTMPLVCGSTMKQYVRDIRDSKQEKNISLIVRYFLCICQGIEHAHGCGILHRDIKPENIMIGRYREIMIVDWGLGIPINDVSESNDVDDKKCVRNKTKPGKCPGTLNYLAPERLFVNATIKSDIYSLGILFHIMLLQNLPFKRKDMADFRMNWVKESLSDWRWKAKDSNIPSVLLDIIAACIDCDPTARYHSVSNLLKDIYDFFDGRFSWNFSVSLPSVIDDPTWLSNTTIDINTQGLSLEKGLVSFSSPMRMLVSDQRINENFKLELEIIVSESFRDFAIMFDFDDYNNTSACLDGYVFFIKKHDNMYRGVLCREKSVLLETNIFELRSNRISKISIEKRDFSVSICVNSEVVARCITLLVCGERFGLLVPSDMPFSIISFKCLSGGVALSSTCLSVPDRLLQAKKYSEALYEYSKLIETFKGCYESFLAAFRSAIILIKMYEDQHSDMFLEMAENHLNYIIGTSMAPLGYIGKSLVYRSKKEFFDEINILELGCARFKEHAKFFMLQDMLMFRLYQTRNDQDVSLKARIMLAIARTIPSQFVRSHCSSFVNLFLSNIRFPLFWDVSCSCHPGGPYFIFFKLLDLAFILNDIPAIKYMVDGIGTNSLICIEGEFKVIYVLLIVGEHGLAMSLLNRTHVQKSIPSLSSLHVSEQMVCLIQSIYKNGMLLCQLEFLDFVERIIPNMSCDVFVIHLGRMMFMQIMRAINASDRDLVLKVCSKIKTLCTHKVLKDFSSLYNYADTLEDLLKSDFKSVIYKSRKIISDTMDTQDVFLIHICNCALVKEGFEKIPVANMYFWKQYLQTLGKKLFNMI